MARRSTTDRVLRMLSVVPWIAAHDGPRVDEVCERFGLDRAQLIDDLNVVQLVGLPPYTPDMLIEVVFEGDRVWVRFADVFARPLRLTPDQALALVAAGAALADSSGDGTTDGPLATGLAKLADMLGIAPSEAIAIRLGASRPEVLELLRRAVREQRRIDIDYFAYHRDERTTRQVDPYRVFAAEGAWYVVGYCHLAEATRTFRADRIYRLDLLDAEFERSAAVATAAAQIEAGSGVLDLDPDAARVRLELAPSARWVVETYPVEEVTELAGGRLRARLAVTSRAWLERLLLRLGPEAQLMESTDLALLTVCPEAAQRVLARYRQTSQGVN